MLPKFVIETTISISFEAKHTEQKPFKDFQIFLKVKFNERSQRPRSEALYVNRVHFCFRFKAWASKLDVTPAGVLVFAETGKELLPTEDIDQVVMNIHCGGSEGNAPPHRKLQTVIRKVFFFRVPLGLENLGKWESIFQSGKSQGILNRLEKSGKSHKILEDREVICYFVVIFKLLCIILLKWIKFSVNKMKHLKNTGKWGEKILWKSVNFVSPEKWEPCF